MIHMFIIIYTHVYVYVACSLQRSPLRTLAHLSQRDDIVEFDIVEGRGLSSIICRTFET